VGVTAVRSGTSHLVPWRGLRRATLVLVLLFLVLPALVYSIDFASWQGCYAALVITGPYFGFIAHGGQSCCRARTDELLPGAASLLALGVLAAFVPWPAMLPPRAVAAARVFLWCLGWTAWIASAVLSFGHIG
jgi:hypothetical protein